MRVPFQIPKAVIITLMLVAAGDDDSNTEHEPEGDDQQTSGKTRHGRRLGKYKYKEEVIKRVEFNHPCRWAMFNHGTLKGEVSLYG